MNRRTARSVRSSVCVCRRFSSSTSSWPRTSKQVAASANRLWLKCARQMSSSSFCFCDRTCVAHWFTALCTCGSVSPYLLAQFCIGPVRSSGGGGLPGGKALGGGMRSLFSDIRRRIRLAIPSCSSSRKDPLGSRRSVTVCGACGTTSRPSAG